MVRPQGQVLARQMEAPKKLLRNKGRLDNYNSHREQSKICLQQNCLHEKYVNTPGDDHAIECFSTVAIIHSNPTAQTALESQQTEEKIDKCPSTQNCA